MKIAVNTRLLLQHQLEGIGRYTLELFSRIVKQHPEHEFHFIFDRMVDKQYIFAENVIPHVVFPPVRHPFLAIIWFDFQVKKTLKKIQPDIFISPDGMNSLRPVCKTITVFHDINFVHFPEYFPFFLKNYYLKRTPIIAQRSNRIITVSDYSAKDISETYNIETKKIVSIYNSVGGEFTILEEEQKLEVKMKYANGKPFFVFIGGMYHRKNLVNQFKAFELFKDESDSDLQMIYVGQILKDAKRLLENIEYSKYKKDVHVLGRMPESEMKLLLGSALALTYVSSMEGFGMPLVEAMKSGVPIITGNNSSMPEICEDAALYADPKDPKDIAVQMKKITESSELRISLIKKGLIRANSFSWDQSAEKFWSVIEECVEN